MKKMNGMDEIPTPQNMKLWIEDVLKQPRRIAIPIMTNPGIELIGRTVYEAVTDGRIHFEAVRALDAKYPGAACTVIMDLTVEAEAFGAEIVFLEDEIPSVTGRLVTDWESVSKLTIPDVSAARIPQYLLANRLIAENISGKPVLSGCIGPFSLACRLYDMSELMMACYCEPETAKRLLEKCSHFLINYCKALKQQGVNGVLIAEPAAGLLSGEGCEEFSSHYIKQIVDTVQNEEFMVVIHNCGNNGKCTVAMLITGAMAYLFGNMIDMVTVFVDCPADVLVLGNLDPVGLLKSAEPQTIKSIVCDLLERTKQYPNFVLSSGCDVPPHTPQANIEAFYGALRLYNE
jgi:uroporphyrinogen decarboxylase